MYRLGDNPIKRRHRHMVFFAVLVLLLLGAGIFTKNSLRSDTTVSPPPPAVSSTVAADTGKTKNIDEPMFSLDVPADWKLANRQTSPVDSYTWESTDSKAAGRAITLYIDTLPTTMGVNRALSVQANGSSITAIGDVSDNCASFTSPTAGQPAVATPAKWGGAAFLCDLGNYERDVVGIVSNDGINKLNVAGQTGMHSLFFTYTDNNIQPDFNIFISALQSFRLK
jgi:hypothetical protein